MDVWNPATQTYDRVAPTTTYAYDSLGRQGKVIDPLGHETAFEYDELGRQTKVIYHDQTFTTTAYDDLGRKTSETDQLQRTTDYKYDALGRLTAVVLPAVTYDDEPVRPRYEYEYNEWGDLIVQRDAMDDSHAYAATVNLTQDRETTFTYDAFGRRTTRTLPLGQTETTHYDELGRSADRPCGAICGIRPEPLNLRAVAV